MKKQTLYSILAALLLAVVAFIFFAPDDYQGNVLQQHDIMQGIANGHEVQDYRDATGESPRWTNALFGGMPTFQISPSYKANSLMGWIFTVYSLGLPSPANLLFIMMAGFFIMGLCMKMRWYVALFASVAWGFSTYFIIIIGAGHIWKFITLAYIPPTIGGLALLYRRKYLAGTALASLFAALQLQSNHPQMSYYFFFLILFMVIAWGVAAWRGKSMRQWGIATACAACAAILALAANSASLYASYEYAKETIRGRATDIVDPDADAASGMDRSAITAWSYGVDETFTLLIPNVKGGATIKPAGGENRMMSMADTDGVNNAYLSPEEMQVVSSFPQYFGDQPMTNGPVYVGALVLILAILAMFTVQTPKSGLYDGPASDRRFYAVAGVMKWALLAGVIFSMCLSWGHNFSPLTDFFIDYVPGYNKFRTPSSILVVLEFCIPLLAALCIRSMIDNPRFYKDYRTVFFAVFGVGAAVCLLGWLAPGMFGSPFSAEEVKALQEQGVFTNPAYANVLNTVREARLGLVSADCARSLAFIVVGGILCFLYIKGAFRKSVLFVGGLTAIVLIDLFTVNLRYVNSENFVEPLPQTEKFEMSAADREILKDTSVYRVIDLQNFDGARSSFFHKTVGGYHAAKLTRYNDLITHQIRPAMARLMQGAHDNAARLQALAADSTASVNTDTLDQRLFRAHEPVLDMLNTKYYLFGDYAEENPYALGNAWFVDRLQYVSGANDEMASLSAISPATTAVADTAFKDILGDSPAKVPGDTVYLTSYAPDRLVYRANSAKGGIAVFSEIYFPWGWTAVVDGNEQPIARVDYTLRALRLAPGSHEIEFRFAPRSLEVTDTIGVIAVIAIFLLCLAAILLPLLHKSNSPKKES